VGLAAVGTVADVVPLTDENRILVRYGLQALKERPYPGVAALCSVAGLADKRQLASEDIAFSLAPRVNAAGRLGQAELAVELLLTDCPQRAQELASFLDEFNRQRDHLERSILHDARTQLQDQFDVERDPAIVLASRDWHVGVIGIVAGRLADRFHRPCVLIAFDELKGTTGCGSARAALGLDLYETLAACGQHLVQFGGHAGAAGLRILPDQLSAFRQAFFAEAERRIAPQERIAELRIDAEAPLPQMTIRAVDQIQQLAPFGQSNPRPLLCATAVDLDGPPRPMGEGNRHLALRLRQNSVTLRAVAFGQGEWAPALQSCQGPIDIAYRPVINEFGGRRSVELHLGDWRPHGG
jgi:single-stranded-DNA-specific exonuclease